MNRRLEGVLEFCLVSGVLLFIIGVSFKLGWEIGLISAGAIMIYIGLPGKGARYDGRDKRRDKAKK